MMLLQSLLSGDLRGHDVMNGLFLYGVVVSVDLFGNEIIEDVLLRDRFLEPPFSVLDSKAGSWQLRKKAWKDKGIESELGRKKGLCMAQYMDLEVYSDNKNDLSNMSNEMFIVKYESIIKKTCSKLKNGSYAVFVVGDVRDKKTGFYKDFITITKKAFYKCGMGLYNEMILLENGLNTAAMRCAKTFNSGKKLTKVHQNILVFKRDIS